MGDSGTHTPNRMQGGDWDRFLTLLDADRGVAAAAYHALRRRLVNLFRWRGLSGPDDLADETIERAVRHLGAGNAIRSITGYVCGIAGRLALEASRRDNRIAPLEDQRTLTDGFDDEVAERLALLERCLDKLSTPMRELVLRYYSGSERIAIRRELARELGIELNALRIRVHRLRSNLEDCVRSAAVEPPRPKSWTSPAGRA